MIEFSEKDILRSKLVTPGWYLMNIDGLEKKLAAKGDSTNYNYETTVVKNADNGDAEFKGVPVTINFNTKAKGFMVGFFTALGGEAVPGARFNEEAVVGKQIEAFIANEEYDGRMMNKIKHQYRAVRSETAA